LGGVIAEIGYLPLQGNLHPLRVVDVLLYERGPLFV
jgi:hypothetical protein